MCFMLVLLSPYIVLGAILDFSRESKERGKGSHTLEDHSLFGEIKMYCSLA